MVPFEESIKKKQEQHKFSWLKQIVTSLADPADLFCITSKIA